MDKKELLETALDYLYELEGEWRWKRVSIERYRRQYEELVEFIDKFRDTSCKERK